MTIVVNDRRKVYTANGVATSFDGPRAFAPEHIAVYLVNIATGAAVLVSAGYTLNGVGGNNTTVVFDSPPASGNYVQILRTVPYSQNADISNQGAYLPEVLENAGLDPIVQQTQQLADGIERALRFPDTVVDFNAEIGGDLNPGNPLFVGSDGKSIVTGDYTGSGDLLLRGDLASAEAGKGGELVKTLQNGLGAIPRTAKDKDRELVTPEDFGALGIGEIHQVSEWLLGGTRDRGYANLAAIQVDYPHVTALTDDIDYAALQAAINYCQSAVRVLWLCGRYWITKGLTITAPISIRGSGWSSTNSIIVAKAAMDSMILIRSATSGDDLRSGELSGFQLSGQALAEELITANSVSWWKFEGLRLYDSTVCSFHIDDRNAHISQRNVIDRVYIANSLAGTENAHCMWLDGGGGNGGCVQNHVRSVYLNHDLGDGLRIGYCDNNIFDFVGDFSQTAGTGKAIRFMAQATAGARNNFVGHVFGIVYAEAGSYGNRISRIISETTYVTVEAGAYLDYVASDYVSADVFETHRYRMSDQLHLPVSGFKPIGAANITTSKTYWTAASITKASGGSIACSFSPYDWNDGTVTGLRLRISSNAVETGKNVRLTVRMAEKQHGETVSFVEKTQLFTVAMPTDDNTVWEADLDFITPMDVRKDCAIFLNIERTIADGADTATGDLFIHTVSVKHQSYGPNYFNNIGRFDVPPPYKN